MLAMITTGGSLMLICDIMIPKGGHAMATEAQRRANAKYDAKNTKQFHLKLNLQTDADILKKFSEVESVQGYIKQLIRDDLARPTHDQ